MEHKHLCMTDDEKDLPRRKKKIGPNIVMSRRGRFVVKLAVALYLSGRGVTDVGELGRLHSELWAHHELGEESRKRGYSDSEDIFVAESKWKQRLGALWITHGFEACEEELEGYFNRLYEKYRKQDEPLTTADESTNEHNSLASIMPSFYKYTEQLARKTPTADGWIASTNLVKQLSEAKGIDAPELFVLGEQKLEILYSLNYMGRLQFKHDKNTDETYVRAAWGHIHSGVAREIIDSHPTVPLHTAKIADEIYYDFIDDVEHWMRREVAVKGGRLIPQFRPFLLMLPGTRIREMMNCSGKPGESEETTAAVREAGFIANKVSGKSVFLRISDRFLQMHWQKTVHLVNQAPDDNIQNNSSMPPLLLIPATQLDPKSLLHKPRQKHEPHFFVTIDPTILYGDKIDAIRLAGMNSDFIIEDIIQQPAPSTDPTTISTLPKLNSTRFATDVARDALRFVGKESAASAAALPTLSAQWADGSPVATRDFGLPSLLLPWTHPRETQVLYYRRQFVKELRAELRSDAYAPVFVKSERSKFRVTLYYDANASDAEMANVAASPLLLLSLKRECENSVLEDSKEDKGCAAWLMPLSARAEGPSHIAIELSADEAETLMASSPAALNVDVDAVVLDVMPAVPGDAASLANGLAAAHFPTRDADAAAYAGHHDCLSAETGEAVPPVHGLGGQGVAAASAEISMSADPAVHSAAAPKSIFSLFGHNSTCFATDVARDALRFVGKESAASAAALPTLSAQWADGSPVATRDFGLPSLLLPWTHPRETQVLYYRRQFVKELRAELRSDAYAPVFVKSERSKFRVTLYYDANASDTEMANVAASPLLLLSLKRECENSVLEDSKEDKGCAAWLMPLSARAEGPSHIAIELSADEAETLMASSPAALNVDVDAVVLDVMPAVPGDAASLANGLAAAHFPTRDADAAAYAGHHDCLSAETGEAVPPVHGLGGQGVAAASAEISMSADPAVHSAAAPKSIFSSFGHNSAFFATDVARDALRFVGKESAASAAALPTLSAQWADGSPVATRDFGLPSLLLPWTHPRETQVVSLRREFVKELHTELCSDAYAPVFVKSERSKFRVTLYYDANASDTEMANVAASPLLLLSLKRECENSVLEDSKEDKGCAAWLMPLSARAEGPSHIAIELSADEAETLMASSPAALNVDVDAVVLDVMPAVPGDAASLANGLAAAHFPTRDADAAAYAGHHDCLSAETGEAVPPVHGLGGQGVAAASAEISMSADPAVHSAAAPKSIFSLFGHNSTCFATDVARDALRFVGKESAASAAALPTLSAQWADGSPVATRDFGLPSLLLPWTHPRETQVVSLRRESVKELHTELCSDAYAPVFVKSERSKFRVTLYYDANASDTEMANVAASPLLLLSLKRECENSVLEDSKEDKGCAAWLMPLSARAEGPSHIAIELSADEAETLMASSPAALNVDVDAVVLDVMPAVPGDAASLANGLAAAHFPTRDADAAAYAGHHDCLSAETGEAVPPVHGLGGQGVAAASAEISMSADPTVHSAAAPKSIFSSFGHNSAFFATDVARDALRFVGKESAASAAALPTLSAQWADGSPVATRDFGLPSLLLPWTHPRETQVLYYRRQFVKELHTELCSDAYAPVFVKSERSKFRVTLYYDANASDTEMANVAASPLLLLSLKRECENSVLEDSKEDKGCAAWLMPLSARAEGPSHIAIELSADEAETLMASSPAALNVDVDAVVLDVMPAVPGDAASLANGLAAAHFPTRDADAAAYAGHHDCLSAETGEAVPPVHGLGGQGVAAASAEISMSADPAVHSAAAPKSIFSLFGHNSTCFATDVARDALRFVGKESAASAAALPTLSAQWADGSPVATRDFGLPSLLLPWTHPRETQVLYYRRQFVKELRAELRSDAYAPVFVKSERSKFRVTLYYDANASDAEMANVAASPLLLLSLKRECENSVLEDSKEDKGCAAWLMPLSARAGGPSHIAIELSADEAETLMASSPAALNVDVDAVVLDVMPAVPGDAASLANGLAAAHFPTRDADAAAYAGHHDCLSAETGEAVPPVHGLGGQGVAAASAEISMSADPAVHSAAAPKSIFSLFGHNSTCFATDVARDALRFVGKESAASAAALPTLSAQWADGSPVATRDFGLPSLLLPWTHPRETQVLSYRRQFVKELRAELRSDAYAPVFVKSERSKFRVTLYYDANASDAEMANVAASPLLLLSLKRECENSVLEDSKEDKGCAAWLMPLSARAEGPSHIAIELSADEAETLMASSPAALNVDVDAVVLDVMPAVPGDAASLANGLAAAHFPTRDADAAAYAGHHDCLSAETGEAVPPVHGLGGQGVAAASAEISMSADPAVHSAAAPKSIFSLFGHNSTCFATDVARDALRFVGKESAASAAALPTLSAQWADGSPVATRDFGLPSLLLPWTHPRETQVLYYRRQFVKELRAELRSDAYAPVFVKSERSKFRVTLYYDANASDTEMANVAASPLLLLSLKRECENSVLEDSKEDKGCAAWLMPLSARAEGPSHIAIELSADEAETLMASSPAALNVDVDAVVLDVMPAVPGDAASLANGLAAAHFPTRDADAAAYAGHHDCLSAETGEAVPPVHGLGGQGVAAASAEISMSADPAVHSAAAPKSIFSLFGHNSTCFATDVARDALRFVGKESAASAAALPTLSAQWADGSPVATRDFGLPSLLLPWTHPRETQVLYYRRQFVKELRAELRSDAYAPVFVKSERSKFRVTLYYDANASDTEMANVAASPLLLLSLKRECENSVLEDSKEDKGCAAWLMPLSARAEGPSHIAIELSADEAETLMASSPAALNVDVDAVVLDVMPAVPGDAASLANGLAAAHFPTRDADAAAYAGHHDCLSAETGEAVPPVHGLGGQGVAAASAEISMSADPAVHSAAAPKSIFSLFGHNSTCFATDVARDALRFVGKESAASAAALPTLSAQWADGSPVATRDFGLPSLLLPWTHPRETQVLSYRRQFVKELRAELRSDAYAPVFVKSERSKFRVTLYYDANASDTEMANVAASPLLLLSLKRECENSVLEDSKEDKGCAAWLMPLSARAEGPSHIAVELSADEAETLMASSPAALNIDVDAVVLDVMPTVSDVIKVEVLLPLVEVLRSSCGEEWLSSGGGCMFDCLSEDAQRDLLEDLHEQLVLAVSPSTNDALEYLGDALLDFVVAQNRLKDWTGGPLTSETKNAGLANYVPKNLLVYLERQVGPSTVKRRADVVEALFGALAMALWVNPRKSVNGPGAQFLSFTYLLKCVEVLKRTLLIPF